MPELDAYTDAAARLPAMPEVAHTLLKSFDQDDLSLLQLAELVGKDQALAAKVLRTANSARYAPPKTIANLRDAASVLGLSTMRDLTLASCLTGSLPECPGFDRLHFWRGTLALATYASTLAKALSVDEETAYVAGLTLRTGQMLMALVDPVAFRQVQGLSRTVDQRFAQEVTAFGLSHPVVTAALAQRWRFPPSLVASFAAAANPLAARPFDRRGAVLRLASVVTDSRELGLPVREQLLQVQGDLVTHLGLDLDWLDGHLCDHALATAGADTLLQ
jgi:HD-like signal output (HDOD) protein